MKDFAGKIAVITGGGTGMGRELARQLVAEGCNVAMCDISAEAMAETKRLCEVERLPQGLRITTHIADVSIEGQLQRFRDELIEQQATDKIHLLFNNAGIGGGGSLFTNTREQWERTFNICWGGVYLGVRTFLPLLVKADEAPHRQYLQRQWVLGHGRAGRVAHVLQCRQIRGKGFHRGADQRSPPQRAAHQMLGGDARPYRHLDPFQFAQGAERHRFRTALTTMKSR